MLDSLPPQGTIRERTHLYPVRVYYEDTDAGGIVYHAGYLRYAERARTEMLRMLGIDHQTLRRDHGTAIVVRRLAAEFEGSARLDDVVEVSTGVERLTGARVALHQHVQRLDMTLVRLHLMLGCVNNLGRARRWPMPVVEAFRHMDSV